MYTILYSNTPALISASLTNWKQRAVKSTTAIKTIMFAPLNTFSSIVFSNYHKSYNSRPKYMAYIYYEISHRFGQSALKILFSPFVINCTTADPNIWPPIHTIKLVIARAKVCIFRETIICILGGHTKLILR